MKIEKTDIQKAREKARRRIKAIQAEAQKAVPFPIMPAYWEWLDEFLNRTVEDYYDDGELEDYVEEYEHVVWERISDIQFHLPSILENYKKELNIAPKSAHPHSESKPVERRRKLLEKRVHIVDFVWEQKGGMSGRANWKKIAAAWNAQHPYDKRTPESLKDRYHKAIKDDDVLSNYAATRIMASASLSGTGKLTCSATVTKAIRETPARPVAGQKTRKRAARADKSLAIKKRKREET